MFVQGSLQSQIYAVGGQAGTNHTVFLSQTSRQTHAGQETALQYVSVQECIPHSVLVLFPGLTTGRLDPQVCKTVASKMRRALEAYALPCIAISIILVVRNGQLCYLRVCSW